MRFAERAERHDILVCRESSCDISVSVFSPFSNCWTRPRLNATEVVKLTMRLPVLPLPLALSQILRGR